MCDDHGDESRLHIKTDAFSLNACEGNHGLEIDVDKLDVERPVVLTEEGCCWKYAYERLCTSHVFQALSRLKKGSTMWLIVDAKERFSYACDWINAWDNEGIKAHIVEVHNNDSLLLQRLNEFKASVSSDAYRVVVMTVGKAVKKPEKKPKTWWDILRPDIMVMPNHVSKTLYQMAAKTMQCRGWVWIFKCKNECDKNCLYTYLLKPNNKEEEEKVALRINIVTRREEVETEEESSDSSDPSSPSKSVDDLEVTSDDDDLGFLKHSDPMPVPSPPAAYSPSSSPLSSPLSSPSQHRAQIAKRRRMEYESLDLL